MIKHLSIRVAWHDNKWNGAVCKAPGKNTYCLNLNRIRDDKDVDYEKGVQGKSWKELDSAKLPPCKAEGGAFMNSTAYFRKFKHPYQNNRNKELPHVKLKPTDIEVPPKSLFSVPFKWMLKSSQWELTKSYPDLPKSKDSPFPSPWVYDREVQEELLKRFFKSIKPNYSLAVFYVKGGNPIDEESRRLIVGVGTIIKKSGILHYESDADYTYPLWDRLITHDISTDNPKSQGILIPYHEYLELSDDFKLKTENGFLTKDQLINEIKLSLSDNIGRKELMDELSYGSEWVENSNLLSILGKLKKIIERVKEHGIVQGHWSENLKWIDIQMGEVKEKMGPFPSFANALLAYKFKYANTIEEYFRAENIIKPKDNPWYAWEDLLYGTIASRREPAFADIPFLKDSWINEGTERKELLEMLSRFELSEKQIEKWFDLSKRRKIDKTLTDKDILENPYIIAELDEGDQDHYPISIETIDNGLFVDKAIQGDFIPPKNIALESPLDKRRIRAILVQILKKAAEEGDTLLSFEELTERIGKLTLQRPTEIPSNYINSQLDYISERLAVVKLNSFNALQLEKYKLAESFFRKVFLARAKRALPELKENWEELIISAIPSFDPKNNRHQAALDDQVSALKRITSRKIAVLNGPAGTGKTTVMGALFGCKAFKEEGVLLLAPTGKARVKLGREAKSEAYTVAQFLNKQKRFNWNTLKPKFQGKDKYIGKQNVIIDESSMLTEDDLYALFQALDLARIKRIIMVGDPSQLPPIGAGRPFADFCNYLENLDKDHKDYDASFCLSRLKEVVRTAEAGSDSDSLTLASWFSGIKPTKSADQIFSKIGDNSRMNDLTVINWKDEDDLMAKLNSTLVDKLNLAHEKDYLGINDFLGISTTDFSTDQIERFQLLTPMRNPFYGSFNLNLTLQKQFRIKRDPIRFGDYDLVSFDKVMQIKNEKRKAYPGEKEVQLSNGQLGVVKNVLKKGKANFANVAFSGEDPNLTFGYKSQSEDSTDDLALELAYAITIHKSQGSDFDLVFLILPKKGRIISRELIYTALTRAKKELILLTEGEDPYWLFNLSKPQYSETLKRNTNIFTAAIRENVNKIPWAEGLIHKTKREGLIVRSKSEVIIANILIEKEIEFYYEREYEADNGQKRIPDFTFIDAAGEIVILEHLGMLSVPSYKADWEKKLKFYQDNGFYLNENLFITTESEEEGINSIEIEKIINQIEELI